MRLKVKIEWQGQPWRKRVKVYRIGVVDAMFGVLVASLYVVKLAVPDLEPQFPAINEADKMNNRLALVFLIFANLLQTFHASRLSYTIRKEEGAQPSVCFEASKTWFDFTQFSYLFAIVKCVIVLSYIFKVSPAPWVVILGVVTLAEVTLKLYFMFEIYGFMKDLKQSLKYLPKFIFLPLGTDEGRVQKGEELDFNDNARLIV